MGGKWLMPRTFPPSTGPVGAVRRLEGDTFLASIHGELRNRGHECSSPCEGTAHDPACGRGGRRADGTRACCANEGGPHDTPILHQPTGEPIPVKHQISPGDQLYWQNLWLWPLFECPDKPTGVCPRKPWSLWYKPGRVLQMGDASDIAALLNVKYWSVGRQMTYEIKARLLMDLAHHFPEVDTLFFTSHRDGTGTGTHCSQELISLRTDDWNPFGCPEHPFLRVGSPPGPCTCKYKTPIASSGLGSQGITSSWIERHQIIC